MREWDLGKKSDLRRSREPERPEKENDHGKLIRDGIRDKERGERDRERERERDRDRRHRSVSGSPSE